MKKSIFTWFNYDIPMQERMKLIKESGFDSVMLWWANDSEEQDGSRFKLPDLASKNNLEIENAHLPFDDINYLWEDNQNTKDYFEYLKKLIIECGDAEIKTVVLHTSGGDNPPPILRRGLEKFQRLVDTAAKYDICVAMENLRRPDYLDTVFESVQANNKGICFDSGHRNCYTPNFNVLQKYKDKIKAIHLHDNLGKDDDHILPFDGTINWTELKKDLVNSNYSGAYSLEVYGNRNGYEKLNAVEFLSFANEKLEKLINL